MTRRWFLQALGLTQMANCSAGGGDEHLMECSHKWVEGPFYVIAADGVEEPRYYSPSLLIRVEHCEECGILRLWKGLRDRNGNSVSQGHVAPDKSGEK